MGGGSGDIEVQPTRKGHFGWMSLKSSGSFVIR